MNILGLKKTRLETAVKSLTTTGIPTPDKRGRHPQARRIPGAVSTLVHKHIESFPTVTNHYTCAKSHNLRYLESKLSIKKLYIPYHLYFKWMKEHYPTEIVVKESYYYRAVFNIKDLSFTPSKSDTCSTCYSLKTAIQHAVNQDKQNYKQLLEQKLEDHTILAREGQRLMKKMANDEDDSTRAICLDLQQTLPIPRLSTNCVAYYKRKI